VDLRQVKNSQGMQAGNRKFLIVIVQQTAPEHFRVNPEIASAKTFFDAYFPDAGRTEIQRIIAVKHEFFGIPRQSSGCGPKQHVRIKKQLHSAPANMA